MPQRIFLYILLILLPGNVAAQNIFASDKGQVSFHSDAAHELIKASSQYLKCALDVQKRTFAFRVEIHTFVGFNNPLQQEHFNENYMESDRYPEATFNGKIIEDIDLSRDGDYEVRAKGKLKVHGIEQERIVTGHVVTKNGKMSLKAVMTISLADHDIKIPRVVYDKLAPDIQVTVSAVLTHRQ